MIEMAFNASLKLKRFVKNNNDGSRVFSDEVELPCYKEIKDTKVLSNAGEEVISKSNYFTTEQVGKNDIIDGNQVLTVEYFNMLGCSYYRSYT